MGIYTDGGGYNIWRGHTVSSTVAVLFSLAVVVFYSDPIDSRPAEQCRTTNTGDFTECISNEADCAGLEDNFYQWCGSCENPVTCEAGSITYWVCPPDTVWDDTWKSCQAVSNTCECQ